MTDYHKLSITEKRASSIATQREPSLQCPNDCGTQVMAADLLAHIETRCSGPREPGFTAKWVAWPEVRPMMSHMTEGAAKMALSRWSRPDHDGEIKVRARGTRPGRVYLLRDLVKQIAVSARRSRR